MLNKIKTNYFEYSTYALWGIGWLSIFVSLYFSEIAKFVPCELCWWQRLLIYPIAIFGTVAIFKKEFRSFAYYALPFGVIGLIASLYHSLLQWGVITHDVLECSVGGAVSCSKPDFLWFGFITIPFLAFLGFVTVTAIASAAIYVDKKSPKNA